MKIFFAIATGLALATSANCRAQNEIEHAAALGANLERFEYPWETRQFSVTVGATQAQMTYMDVQPEQTNGRTAVLLHGKNFCGAT